MKFRKYLLLLMFALIIISGQTAEASSVKIWDTIVKDTDHKFYVFEESYAWTNKDNWVQVPHGTLNYNFIGDQVIENGNFWFYIHDSGFDSPFMYANLNGNPVLAGEMYIKTLIPNKELFNFYKKSVIITKNTPEEIIIIVDSGYTAGINVVQYRIKKDSYYIEAKGMTDYKFEAGFHSAPNRFAVAPIKNGDGTDFVIDPENYSDIPEGKHIFFYPDEQYENMMIQEILNGGWFFETMIIYDDWTFAQPFIEVSKEPGMRLDSIRAYMQPGTSNERIIFGLINEENIFHEESPNIAISAGGSYTSIRDLTIPGRWRMSGRIRAADGSEHYYTQDVYDQKFVFVSPISGTLEALALYLYDRTSGTPSDITTSMDVYRDVTGQTTTLSAIPPAPSLIMNPGFESGATTWIFYTNGVAMFSLVSPGYEGNYGARLALSSAGTNIQFYQKDISLEPNTRYRLSFAAYSTTGHDVTARLLKHVSPYTAYSPDFTANLGTNWQTFTTEFTTSGFTDTVNDGRLQFWLAPFAASGDTYYIDNIQLDKT